MVTLMPSRIQESSNLKLLLVYVAHHLLLSDEHNYLQWRIQHLGEYNYHIFIENPAPQIVVGNPAVDINSLLFVPPNELPPVWVICGEAELPGGRHIYMYLISPS